MLLSCNFESILIDLIDCLNRGCQLTVFKSLRQRQMLRNRSKPDGIISILGIFLLNKTIRTNLIDHLLNRIFYCFVIKCILKLLHLCQRTVRKLNCQRIMFSIWIINKHTTSGLYIDQSAVFQYTQSFTY